MNGEARDPVDGWIDALLIPRAGPSYDEIRGEALAQLLARGEEAHARIVERAGAADPPVQLLAVLPLFGRPEGVEVLRRALADGPGPTTVTAAHALARHPVPAALDALVAALGSPRPQVVASAAAGLAERGDPRSAEPLERALDTAPDEALPAVRRALERLRGGRGA
ncbi:MAG TPA: HEAT repeat domain-containing protein [Longimicrobium sp.]|jgi:HEAT repeat protein